LSIPPWFLMLWNLIELHKSIEACGGKMLTIGRKCSVDNWLQNNTLYSVIQTVPKSSNQRDKHCSIRQRINIIIHYTKTDQQCASVGYMDIYSSNLLNTVSSFGYINTSLTEWPEEDSIPRWSPQWHSHTKCFLLRT